MAELERVGRYRVVAPLRVGGMARVDLARLDGPYGFTRHVVVKRPLAHQANDEAALAQIRLEAKLLAGIHHPNVIGFLDAGRDYLAIDYVHGLSLRELAPPRGGELARRPSLAAALSIAVEVARGLDCAHDRPGGVVHRDVSPSNVLLGYDGSVVLIDFGVAKLTEGATLSGGLRGKITYMAPEQCKGEAIDRRADVYALGVILYELVTGRRPFHAADDVASLHRIVSGAAVPPAGVDAELDAVIAKAMSYAAADRHATAGAFADALEAHARAGAIELGARVVAGALAELGPARAEPWRAPVESLESRSRPESPRRHSDSSPGGEAARGRAKGLSPRKGRRTWAVVAGVAVIGAIAAVIVYAQIASPSQAAATSVPSSATKPDPPAAPAERSDALRTMIPAESVGRPVLRSSPAAPAERSDALRTMIPAAPANVVKDEVTAPPASRASSPLPASQDAPRKAAPAEQASVAPPPAVPAARPPAPPAARTTPSAALPAADTKVEPRRAVDEPKVEQPKVEQPKMPKLDQPTVGEPTVAAPVIEDKPAPVWDPKDSGLPGKRKKKP